MSERAPRPARIAPAMSEAVREPFADPAHQRDAVALGMWAFLGQEVLFFGVLFVFYTHLRVRHPELFAAFAPRLDWRLATAMTVALLLSSFTMALAVRFAFVRMRGKLLSSLLATTALGAAFLAMKGWEYAHHVARGESPIVDLADELGPGPGLSTFFGLYFVLTGFHALHVLGGLVALGWLVIVAWRTTAEDLRGSPVMAVGLYWHFVDIVWLFLFPALYLAGRPA
ncbi:cytochrome c oxidase subunit 3 [Nannocystis exedens]|uniref:Cytochrome c oxidase subunit 3 n=1 Tax=Nannocystis exedens TaxID=54 RepID=A0A1I1UUK6_9BACT|nr:cytochrome c oxidase subunit 3 [Nannocystis exedens]PCC72103.1 cytochrome c oxidase subunit III [Nannocystis exedens]SFD74436.1 cytochrome c oxidase subunit 3 [Nannocystis exedens]